MSEPTIEFVNKLGSKEKPKLAGQSAGVAAKIRDHNGNLLDAKSARWNFDIAYAPPNTVRELHADYSPTPSISTLGYSYPGYVEIQQSGVLRLAYAVDGVPGYPDWKSQGYIEGWVEASKTIGFNRFNEAVVWETPKGRVGKPEEVTRWLDGYGPMQQRKKLVPSYDIPETVEFVSGRMKIRANLRFGGFIDQLWIDDVQCVDDGRQTGKMDNGRQVQFDAREFVYDGSAIPGKNFLDKGILFPTQGGSAQHTLSDAEYRGKESTVYEFETFGNGYRVLVGLQWYSALRGQNPPDVYLSDWLLEWEVRLADGRLTVGWRAWHEGADRKVISVVPHCHLLPSVFRRWNRIGNTYFAYGPFTLEFEAPTATRHTALWHQDWRIYNEDKQDFGQERPENAVALHFKPEQVVNRSVRAGEVFTGHFYIRAGVPPDPPPPPPPDPDPLPVLPAWPKTSTSKLNALRRGQEVIVEHLRRLL